MSALNQPSIKMNHKEKQRKMICIRPPFSFSELILTQNNIIVPKLVTVTLRSHYEPLNSG